MADMPIKFILTEQVQRVDARGNLVDAFRVEFEVGDQGPFFIELDKAEFIPERVRSEAERVASTVRDLNSG